MIVLPGQPVARALIGLVCAAVAAPLLLGCLNRDRRDAQPTTRPQQSTSPGLFSHAPAKHKVQAVRCVFDQRPWLNLDAAGDRDPEGIRFRVFLVDESGKGVQVDGILHVEMYAIERKPETEVTRTLFSDWHYATDAVHRIDKPGMLGEGYFPHLQWKNKKIAGKEIEIITSYESPEGRVIRSATKRLRVPQYAT